MVIISLRINFLLCSTIVFSNLKVLLLPFLYVTQMVLTEKRGSFNDSAAYIPPFLFWRAIASLLLLFKVCFKEISLRNSFSHLYKKMVTYQWYKMSRKQRIPLFKNWWDKRQNCKNVLINNVKRSSVQQKKVRKILIFGYQDTPHCLLQEINLSMRLVRPNEPRKERSVRKRLKSDSRRTRDTWF